MTYVPQVGDRVRRPTWADDWVEVLAVDGQVMATRSRLGCHDWYTTSGPWVKVVEPLPEAWAYTSPSSGIIYGWYDHRNHCWGADHLIHRIPDPSGPFGCRYEAVAL